MKKLILCFLIALISYPVLAQEYGWTDISANLPDTPNLSDVYFVSVDEGWITSSSHAEIYHTTDGGETFEVQTTELTCNAIHMLNANEGYVGGASGFVYRTTDGGDNWNFHGTMVATLADISFPPANDIGYCCGINGAIGEITPEGVSQMNSGVPDGLYSITFPMNSTEGWVCGGSIIRHFINESWTAADQDYPMGGYNAIHMVDSLNGWVVGDGGIIAHTIDGQNWFEQENQQENSLIDVYFLDLNNGWCSGSGGTIIHTNNGGENWIVEGAGITSNSLTGVHFTSPTNGYVVGNGNTLLKYGELTSSENDEIPVDILHLQNYPNPFNPETEISYQLSKICNISLSIYDIKGRLIKTLVNDIEQSGTHSVVWFGRDENNDPVSSGIYFSRLVAGNKILTKRMVLLK